MKALRTLLFSFALFGTTACEPAIEQIDLSGETMGTTFGVSAIGSSIDSVELRQQIEDTFAKITDQMSTWDDDSEISRFNRYKQGDWFNISDEFVRVLQSSQQISLQTEGAFDVTVGGIVKLWGFGEFPRQQIVPETNRIAEALSYVGPSAVEINASTSSIRKIDPKTQLDLSGIAKGYAVDAVVNILEREGIENFLVEVGGEIRAAGRRLDGSTWRVAIEKPTSQSRSLQLILNLEDAALATSGDYLDYFEIDSKRYSHIIDPRTGWPPDNGVASVSVITESAMRADALATALIVLGTRKALSLAADNNLAVMVIEREGGDFRVFKSEAFEAMASLEAEK